MTLEEHLNSGKKSFSWERPQIFDLSKEADCLGMKALFEDGKVKGVHDCIASAIGELFDIKYPARKDIKTSAELMDFSSQLTGADPNAYGVWVFYPWSGNIVHFPPVDDYRLLRTARNRNLITEEEQHALASSTVLITGLSVGSSAVEMFLGEGVGGTIILADMDIIEPTNLNRIKVSYQEVGVHKVDAMAKRISEIDPFITQVHYSQGLSEDNLKQLFTSHAPDVIIDEMDDLRMKIKLREMAKEYGRPVLMATDDGENALLDIERYDTNADQQMFEGRLSREVIEKILHGELSRPEIGMLIGKHFVGAENVPIRMFESLREVGKTLPSWPQIAGAATLSGVCLVYAAKKIILKQPLIAGRHLFDLDKELDPEIQLPAHQEQLGRYRELFSSPGPLPSKNDGNVPDTSTNNVSKLK